MLGKQVFFFHLRNSSKTIPNHSNNQSFKISKTSEQQFLSSNSKKFNLLSDTFMSVALRDREAAQEVIRVFTGIKDLRIISLSTQVRLPRMVAHDAMLDMAWLEKGGSIPYSDGIHIIYANAEVNDGTEIARTMQYFKESDPMDQSHGALSKRVHYLKCEERTWVWQRRTSPRRCTQTLHR